MKQPHELAIVLGLGPKRTPPSPPSRMQPQEETPSYEPAEKEAVDGTTPCMHASTCPFYNKPVGEGTEEPPTPEEIV